VRDRSTFVALRRAPRVRRGLLTVAWLDDGAPPPPRVAYTVSRKVGGAVQRNRVRRRLRALARTSGLAPGAWLVVAAPGAASVTFPVLQGWWASAVEELV
jgi:ribonuclease P protein component